MTEPNDLLEDAYGGAPPDDVSVPDTPADDTATDDTATDTDDVVDDSAMATDDAPADTTTTTTDTDDDAGDDWLTGDLRDQLADYGVDEDDAMALGSPEAAQATLNMLARQTLAAGKQTQAAPAKKPDETPAPSDYEPIKLKLDGDEWDEQTKTVLTDITDQFNKKLETQHKQNIELQQRVEEDAIQAESERFTSWLDEGFTALGEEYHGRIGKGTAQDLPENSSEMKTRRKIGRLTAVLIGESPDANPDALRRQAIAAVCSDVVSKTETKKAARALKARSKQTTGKPNRKAAGQLDSINEEFGMKESDARELKAMAAKIGGSW
jgi:hypothetical protein